MVGNVESGIVLSIIQLFHWFVTITHEFTRVDCCQLGHKWLLVLTEA